MNKAELNREELRKSINSQIYQCLYDADNCMVSDMAKNLREITFTDQLASF